MSLVLGGARIVLPGASRPMEQVTYEIMDEMPRRTDSSGEFYKALKRVQGSTTAVALKVSSGSSKWAQEVRLLRRLRLMQKGSPAPFVLELVDEMSGGESMPTGTRFMVLRPIFWRSMTDRIKTVERGVMERYSDRKALLWCWQVVRALWALQEADLYFSTLTLNNILLTQPEGEVRLTGFDVVGPEKAGPLCVGEATHEGEAVWDSRVQLRDLGRCLLQILTCHPEDTQASRTLTASTAEEELRRYPPPARAAVSGLLSCGGPSRAMPLGVVLDSFNELRAYGALDEEGPADGYGPVRPSLTGAASGGSGGGGSKGNDVGGRANCGRLKALEEAWWDAVQCLAEVEGRDDGSGKWTNSRCRGESGVEECKAGGGGGGGDAEDKTEAGVPPRTQTVRCGSNHDCAVVAAMAAIELGSEYAARGKPYKALELYADAYVLISRGHRQGQDLLLEIWSKQAEALQSSGNPKAAIPILEHLLGVYSEARDMGQREQALMMTSVHVRLARARRSLGLPSEALLQLECSQEVLKGAGGDDDARGSEAIASVVTEKAACYSDLGDWVKALELYDEAIEQKRMHVPKNDPSLSAILIQMASVYAERGDVDVALEVLVKAYKRLSDALTVPELCEVKSVEECLSAAHALETIGKLFVRKGQLDDGLMCLRAAHERRLMVLPVTHRDVASTLYALGATHEKRDDPHAAALAHEQALEIRRSSLPPLHADLAASMMGLGNARLKMGQVLAGVQLYEEAEAILRSREPTVELGNLLHNKSSAFVTLNRPADAYAALKEARDVYRKSGVSAEDPRVQRIGESLKRVSIMAARAAATKPAAGNGLHAKMHVDTTRPVPTANGGPHPRAAAAEKRDKGGECVMS